MSKIARRARWFVADALPERHVIREVQGVRLAMPWAHRLPDFTRWAPYGENLVAFSRELGRSSDGPLVVIDVGANIGDSAAQINAATESMVVCIEADDAIIPYLRENTAGQDNVIVEAFLVPTMENQASVRPVRSPGMTKYAVAQGPGADGPMLVTPSMLRESIPQTEMLRLIKSDTDGFDVALIPALARAWKDLSPALFFEYDLHASRLEGNEPLAVWASLGDLGYTDVGIWSNRGYPLGRSTVVEMREMSKALERNGSINPVPYWDVAVAHHDDEVAKAAIAMLCA